MNTQQMPQIYTEWPPESIYMQYMSNLTLERQNLLDRVSAHSSDGILTKKGEQNGRENVSCFSKKEGYGELPSADNEGVGNSRGGCFTV
jgi:hypothetical protein